MSRVLACVANDPQRLRCVLHAGRALLGAREEAPIDGWGVGFYQGGEVLLQRRPKASPDIDLYEELKDVKSDVLIAHVRRGTVGDSRNENTHPFRFRSWLFAHEGTLAAFAERKNALLDPVPDFLRRNIRGQTDSEHLFLLFLARLQAAGQIDDPALSATAAATALGEAIAHAERVLPPGESTYDLAATNGRILVVTRRGPPVRYYRIEGLRNCPVCQGSPQAMGRLSSADHEHLRAIVAVAGASATGSPAPGVPWQELADHHALCVSRELRVDVVPLP